MFETISLDTTKAVSAKYPHCLYLEQYIFAQSIILASHQGHQEDLSKMAYNVSIVANCLGTLFLLPAR